MLNQKKHDIRLRSMSAVARRVYEAVPIETAWSVSFVQSELSRTGSSTGRDVHVLKGCLASLVEAGLVIEPERGLFQRAPLKPESNYEPQKDQTQMKTKASAAIHSTSANSLSRLAELGQGAMQNAARMAVLAEKAEALASTMREMVEELCKLSKNIDESALDIEEQKQSANADADKLKQLQQLLKSLAT